MVNFAQAIGLRPDIKSQHRNSYWDYRVNIRQRLASLQIEKPAFLGNLLKGLQTAALPVYLTVMPILAITLILGPTALVYWFAAGSGLGLVNTIMAIPLVATFFRPLILLAMFGTDKTFEPCLRYQPKMCNDHLGKMSRGIDKVMRDIQTRSTNQADLERAEQIMAAYFDELMGSTYDLGELAGMQQLVSVVRRQIMSPFFCSKLERRFAQLKEILEIRSQEGTELVTDADLTVNGTDLLGELDGSINSLLNAIETLTANCPDSMRSDLDRIRGHLRLIRERFNHLREDITEGCEISYIRDVLAGIFDDVASVAYVINNKLAHQIELITEPARNRLLNDLDRRLQRILGINRATLGADVESLIQQLLPFEELYMNLSEMDPRSPNRSELSRLKEKIQTLRSNVTYSHDATLIDQNIHILEANFDEAEKLSNLAASLRRLKNAFDSNPADLVSAIQSVQDSYRQINPANILTIINSCGNIQSSLNAIHAMASSPQHLDQNAQNLATQGMGLLSNFPMINPFAVLTPALNTILSDGRVLRSAQRFASTHQTTIHMITSSYDALKLVNFEHNDEVNINPYLRMRLADQALEQLQYSPYYISRATPKSAWNKLKWWISGGFLGINRDASVAANQFARYLYGSDMSAETIWLQLVRQTLSIGYEARFGLSSGSKFDRFLKGLEELKKSYEAMADPQQGSQILGMGPFAYMLYFANNGIFGYLADKYLYSPVAAAVGALRGQR